LEHIVKTNKGIFITISVSRLAHAEAATLFVLTSIFTTKELILNFFKAFVVSSAVEVGIAPSLVSSLALIVQFGASFIELSQVSLSLFSVSSVLDELDFSCSFLECVSHLDKIPSLVALSVDWFVLAPTTWRVGNFIGVRFVCA
jgi:K+-sensing histidine kinase KdpD